MRYQKQQKPEVPPTYGEGQNISKSLPRQSSRSDHWKVFTKKKKVPFATHKQDNSFWVLNRELEKLPQL